MKRIPITLGVLKTECPSPMKPFRRLHIQSVILQA